MSASMLQITYLMRGEFRVIQFPQRALHILLVGILDDSGAVLEHVGVTNVSALPHVVLHVLPRPRTRQPCKQYGDSDYLLTQFSKNNH